MSGFSSWLWSSSLTPSPPSTAAMAESDPPPIQSSQPTLSPQFCFDTTTLRDFLRLSRSTLDDSISAHLNSLLTPSRAGFAPTSTSTRPIRPSSRAQLPEQACMTFKSNVLFPSWQARENVIRYCSRVAATQDPEAVSAPEPVATPSTATGEYTDGTSSASSSWLQRQRQSHHEQQKSPSEEDISERQRGQRQQTGPSDLWKDPPAPLVHSNGAEGIVSRNYWGREQVVDERTDPYSAKDYSYTREGRQQVLSDVLRNEEGVERIVRARTWGVLCERCVGGRASASFGDEGWKAEFDRWKS